MHPDVEQRLESYRRDFESVEGKPFRHFFCPILGTDEPIVSPNILIKGHIINRAFENAPSAWVVQRRDVDNFYGSKFESEFETLQYRDRLTPSALLSNKTLAKKFRPTISHDGKTRRFVSQPSTPPDGFTRIELGDGPEAPAIAIDMTHEELLKASGGQWEFSVVKDVRIPAFVSLLKAAHLTTFHLLGYRYATSAAGLLIGRDLLGKFYAENAGRPQREVLAKAWPHFREFAHASRPMLNAEVGYQGTVTDRRVLACYATSGRVWAQIVLIRTGPQMHAVMLPAFDFVESVATYLDFMSNDNETIEVATAEFDRREQRWTLYADRRRQHWPKGGLPYPEMPESIELPRFQARARLPE